MGRHLVAVLVASSCAKTPVDATPTERAPLQNGDLVCPAIPEDTVGLLDDEGGCDAVLVARGSELAVLVREPEATRVVASGSPPPGCERSTSPCSYEGVMTAAGPLVLAARRGPQSEIPEALELGITGEGQLLFVPLWVDPPAVEHDTFVGPVFALEPRVCADSIVLVPVPRLPSAGDEVPSELLRARAGVHVVRDGDVVVEPWNESGSCTTPLRLP
jgi:hypothetical protein